VFLPFWLFIYLSILIHELGHLLGAVLVGWLSPITSKCTTLGRIKVHHLEAWFL